MSAALGSSPRPVHPRPCGTPLGHRPRFIPARAGNTCGTVMPTSSGAVHPRPCGEHLGLDTGARKSAGSSPPVRGTLRTPGAAPSSRRFIPARAGNTHIHHRITSAAAVHPRQCGEHSVRPRVCESPIGSSPPVRGTHRCEADKFSASRFIPARAGNTRGAPSFVLARTVHPRPCVSVGRWPRFLAVGRGLARATLTSAREAGRRFGGWDGQRCG